MMPGMIMLWYGSVATVPSGWAVCDGNNGTPNLKGKFIRGGGSGPGTVPGATGGSESHTHDFTGDGHAHDLTSGIDVANVSPAGAYYHGTGSVPAAGTTDSEDTRPSFHNLCYIMKLPIP